MTTITVKESAAASALDTDLLSGTRISFSGKFRRVRRIGVVGSAVVGDAAVDLYYGDTFVGRFYNSSAGANLIPLDAKDLVNVASDSVCEPGEQMQLRISDAGATNVIVATLEVDELS